MQTFKNWVLRMELGIPHGRNINTGDISIHNIGCHQSDELVTHPHLATQDSS